MKWKGVYTGWLVAVLIIAAGFGWYGWHRYVVYQEQPKLNPNPKYYVTISGNIQPHMRYPETLLFRATYGAYKPSCHKTINWLAGVSGMPGKPDYYPVHPDAEGNYVVKIPIDRYLAGQCDWKIAWILSSINPIMPPKKDWPDKTGYSDLIDFGHYGSKTESPGYPVTDNATLYCGKGPSFINCSGTGIVTGYSHRDVLRNQSYHFIQNIKSNGDK